MTHPLKTEAAEALARVQQARATAQSELVERRKQRRAKRERIAVLQSAMDDAAEALVAHTLALGPLLERWAAVGAEHGALCLSFAREAEHDLSFGRQRIREGLEGCADPTRGPLNDAFAVALWVVGVGRVGPELSNCGIQMHYAGSPEDRANPIGTYHERMRAVRQQVQGLLDRAEARIAANEANPS